MSVHRCAICSREITYTGPRPALYPFCSRRCKLVDLGVWLREGYALDRDLTPDELERADDGSAGNAGPRRPAGGGRTAP